jgi:membrane associated rhomboid family serine protease
LAGGFSENRELYGKLGLSRHGLVDGCFWQPFSYALIHGNWVHFMINAFGLLAIGPRIERIGGGRLLLILLSMGWLAGGLLHLLLNGGGAMVPLVGISGGVVALLLWLTGVSPGSRCLERISVSESCSLPPVSRYSIRVSKYRCFQIGGGCLVVLPMGMFPMPAILAGRW